MKSPKSEPQKGDKKRYIREAVETLGLDASYTPALKWIKGKYGVEVGEPTYYGVRREMQLEATAKQGQPRGGRAAAPAGGGEPTPAGAAVPQTETLPGPTPQRPDRATQPSAAPGKRKSSGVTAQEAGGRGQPQEGAGETQDGVAALVLQAKALVERLGKEEAKRLIDAL